MIDRRKLSFAGLLVGLMLALGVKASCQHPMTTSPGAPTAAQGTLTVTATVVASVGLVTGPNGEQRLVLANAADPRDNVSLLQNVRFVSMTAPAADDASKRVKKKKN